MTPTRAAALILTLAAVGPAVARAQPPVVLRPPGGAAVLPGMPEPASARLAARANQLILQLQSFRNLVGTLPLPTGQRLALRVSADRTLSLANTFHQNARQAADPSLLLTSHQQLDAALEALLTAAGPVAAQHPSLQQAVAGIRYADDRIHAALSGGATPAPDFQLRQIARTARAAEREVEQVRAALAAGGAVPIGLPRALQTTAARCGQLARLAQSGAALAQLQTEYTAAVAAWQQAGPWLATAAGVNPELRLQAAEVDALFRDLGDRLTPGGPIVPGPVFPVVPGRGRVLVVGAGEGGGPHVKVMSDPSGAGSADFFAYDPSFRGGVRVAVADLTGDGVPEIVTGPGRGGPPIVRVFDGRDFSLLTEFTAFDPPHDLGVYVAAADRTANGRSMVAVGSGEGGPAQVRVFDLAAGTMIDQFTAHPPELLCGVRVAFGDVDGDGMPDLITAPGPHPQAGPLVQVFSGVNRRKLAEFNAYDDAFRGGVYVAAGRVVPNGRAEVLTGPGEGGGGVVRVFDPTRNRLVGEVQAFGRGYRGGVRVAAGVLTPGAGADVIAAAGPGRGGLVKTFDGRDRSVVGEFSPFGLGFTGGAYVAGR
ncbi:MAG: hypothetical protein U0871_23295 [Gemmataceae bacterium]